MVSHCANFLTRPPTGTPRRAINPSEGLPRPRVARAKKIIRLHPLLCSASKEGAPGRSFFSPTLLLSQFITEPSKGVRSFRLRPASECLLRGRVPGAKKALHTLAPSSLRRIRRHEDEDFEALVCVILHAMFFPGRRHGPLPRTENLLLRSHLEHALSLKHKIDFVLLTMDMALLFLPWLETVDVAEKSRRLKHIVLLHLFTAKLLIVRDVHDVHSSTPSGMFLLCSTTLQRGQNGIDRYNMMREPQVLSWKPHRQTE